MDDDMVVHTTWAEKQDRTRQDKDKDRAGQGTLVLRWLLRGRGHCGRGTILTFSPRKLFALARSSLLLPSLSHYLSLSLSLSLSRFSLPFSPARLLLLLPGPFSSRANPPASQLAKCAILFLAHPLHRNTHRPTFPPSTTPRHHNRNRPSFHPSNSLFFFSVAAE